MPSGGIHKSALNSINHCDIDVRKHLLANIILSGGSTMFPHIDTRFQRELVNIAPTNAQIRIVAPSQRKFSVWIGGSILGSLISFGSKWMTRAHYDEYGPTHIHRVCTAI